jgi:O-antigen/teichoic acid export membrane protein
MQLVNLGTLPLVLDAQQRQALDERDHLLRRNLVWSLLAGMPLALLLALLAEPVARTFLAPQYAAPAAACIPWVVLGVLLNRLRTNHVDLAFLISGRTLMQLRGGVLGAGVALSLTWLLVPTFGVSGAAMATAIAYGVALAVNWLSGRAVLMLPWPSGDVGKLLGAMTLPVLLLLNWQPAPGIATGLTVALLLLTIAAGVVLADVDGLRQLLRARRAPRPPSTPRPATEHPLPAHTPTRHFT